MAGWKKAFVQLLSALKRANSRSYFLKLIWFGCISVCVPVILASVVYYQYSMNKMEKYIHSESTASLSAMRDRAERVLQQIEQESLQLANDAFLQDSLAGGAQPSVLTKTELLKKIALVKNFNSFINEIYLYSSSDNLVLSNEYGAIAKEDYRTSSHLDELLQSNHPTQWTKTTGREGFITFSRALPLIGTEGPKGILGFEIETAALSKFMETDTTLVAANQELMIVKLNDPFGSERRSEQFLESLTSLPAIEKIRESDKSADFFVAEGIDGKQAQYRFVKNVFSRTYISVVPEQIITDQLSWIRQLTAFIIVVFAAIGILLTYINSRRAYTPIEQLIQHSRQLRDDQSGQLTDDLGVIQQSLDYLSGETKKLESYMQSLEPSLREKFLYQLLSGDYRGNQSLLQDCETYGMEMNNTYVTLLVEAENIYKEKRFMPEEKGIVAFSLANVMQEILSGRDIVDMKGFVIPFQGRGAAILQFKPDRSDDVIRQHIQQYVHAIIDAFRHYLAFEVTVGIGRSYSHIADVPVSCNEADHALQYRLFRESEQVLFIDEVEQVKSQSLLRYPSELETDILDALKQDDLQQATELFEKFIATIHSSQSYAFIYQSYHVFLSKFIISMEAQGASSNEIIAHNLFGQLRSMQTSDEMKEWFKQKLFPLFSWLTASERESSGDSAIEWICNYIEQNCGQDLSLVHCADKIGVSPSYLSRLFKKKTGKNFLEFVVETKMEEAKRLLKDTDGNISLIAEAVGYSERNFIRVFQRYVHTTPGNFRTLYR
ncbi:helix-turn-helix domain-containing protein [Paenibacillus sp. IITD108]|uniref:helix-turn-helix domain-containing protein n=1 Tax=Paenibacillus sp. IITD108 TaxID=3116649 RepID=UPI002F3EDA51